MSSLPSASSSSSSLISSIVPAGTSSSQSILSIFESLLTIESDLQKKRIHRVASLHSINRYWSRGLPSVLLAQITLYLHDHELLLPSLVCHQWNLSCQSSPPSSSLSSDRDNSNGSNGMSMNMIWWRIRQRAIAASNIRYGRFGIRQCGSNDYPPLIREPKAAGDSRIRWVLRSDGRLLGMSEVTTFSDPPASFHICYVIFCDLLM
jgi:hypothetical protein